MDRRSKIIGAQAAFAAGMLTLAAAAPFAAANQVLFTDDFNAGLGGMTVTTSDANATATATGAESPFTATAGGKSLTLLDNSTATNPSVVSGTGTSKFAYNPGENTKPLQISFDFYVAAHSPANNDTFLLYSGTNSSSGRGVIFNVDSGGTSTAGLISYGNLSGATVTLNAGSPLALSTWYHATLTVNPGAHTWDLNVHNLTNTVNLTYTGLGFRTNVSSLDNIAFINNVGGAVTGGNYSIDNIRVQTIPTPAALPAGLTLLGLVGLTHKRRR